MLKNKNNILIVYHFFSLWFSSKQGECSENLFILLSGRIELSIMMKNKDNEDVERSVAYVEKGHVFGVEDFFGNETRKIAAKAV